MHPLPFISLETAYLLRLSNWANQSLDSQAHGRKDNVNLHWGAKVSTIVFCCRDFMISFWSIQTYFGNYFVRPLCHTLSFLSSAHLLAWTNHLFFYLSAPGLSIGHGATGISLFMTSWSPEHIHLFMLLCRNYNVFLKHHFFFYVHLFCGCLGGRDILFLWNVWFHVCTWSSTLYSGTAWSANAFHSIYYDGA